MVDKHHVKSCQGQNVVISFCFCLGDLILRQRLCSCWSVDELPKCVGAWLLAAGRALVAQRLHALVFLSKAHDDKMPCNLIQSPQHLPKVISELFGWVVVGTASLMADHRLLPF